MTIKDEAERSLFVFAKDTNTGKISRVAIPSNVQIGLKDNPSELSLLGRFSISTADYTISDATNSVINVDNNETVVCISRNVVPSSGRITVNLPKTPRNGQLVFVKDMTGTASVTPIDVYPGQGFTIDSDPYKTLTGDNGSLAVIWFVDRWRLLVAGIGPGGGGGGSGTNASYLTIDAEPTLPYSKKITIGSGLSSSSGLGTYTISLSNSGVTPGSYADASITVDALGRVTLASNGIGRVWVNGGNKAYTTSSIAITSDALYADSYGSDTYFFVSGSRTGAVRSAFSGSIAAFGGDVVISGSLWLNTGSVRLHGYNSQFVAAGNAGTYLGFIDTIISGTLFQVSDVSGLPLIKVNDDDSIVLGEPFRNTIYLSGAHVGMGAIPPNKNNRLYVSGGIRNIGQTNLEGLTSITGSLSVTGSGGGQITGSITKIAGGKSYMVAGPGVTIVSNSLGQVEISYDDSYTIGADPNATYLVLSTTGSLNGERVLNVSGSSGLLLTDFGANSSASLRINNQIVATVSGTTFTGPISGTIFKSAELSGSHTNLVDGTPAFIAGANILLSTESNGAVKIVGTAAGTGNWVDGINKLYTTASISVDTGGHFADQIGTNIFQYFSGTVGLPWASGSIAAFGGDVNITGSLLIGPESSSLSNKHLLLKTSSIEFDDVHHIDYPSGSSLVTWFGGYNTKFGRIGVNKSIATGTLHIVAEKYDGTFENYDINQLDKQPFTSNTNVSLKQYPWFRSPAQANTGIYSAQSAAINASSSSILTSQIVMTSPWSASFYYKTSTHTSDYLKFSINGVLDQQWSGTIGWAQYTTVEKPAGTYTLTWTYARANTGGVNTTWVDDVVLSVASGSYVPALIVESGSIGFNVIAPKADLHISGSSLFEGKVTVNSGSLYANSISGSITTLTDGTAYIKAGTGIQVITGSDGSLEISSLGGGGSGGATPIHTLQIATAMQTTDFLSASKQSLGMCYWNPSILNQFSGSKQVMWRAIVETSDVSYPVAVDLYDMSGVLYGVPGIISGSILSASSLTPTQLEFDISTQLTGTLSPLLIEARLWMPISSSNGSQVTCKNARIDVLFS